MSQKNQDTKKKQDKQYGTLSSVPDGMTTRLGPNDQQFLVPQYMIPALDHAFASFRQKGDVGALKAKPIFDQVKNQPYSMLGGKMMYPPDPQLSDQENLMLHAEVLALQETLGISYKDASHRLYLAEMEKLKVADEQYKAFKNLASRLTTFVNEINQDYEIVEGTAHDADTTAAEDTTDQ